MAQNLVEDGEPAMKAWIGAAIVAALMLGGAAAIGPATAAEATTAAEAAATTHRSASQRRTHRATRHVGTVYRPVEQPRYLGRPIYYMPAPFPLGFDFGFGWW
jgi:hypothetical protein